MTETVVGIPDSFADRLQGCMPATARLIPISDEGPLPSRVGDVEFLVPSFNRARVSELMPQLHALRVVQTLSAGVDWLLPMAPKGVTVCDASGVHDTPVSEWIVASILSVYKLFPLYRDQQTEGVWRRSTMLESGATDLEGKTILVLGYGSIGAATEARLAPFGAEIVRVARRERSGVHGVGQLSRLLPAADVVVLLLPLTKETRGLVNASFLERMKHRALLVNAARGALVETVPLVRALSEGRIQAALDVTEPEPLPEGHELWSTPDTLITPHIAGHSADFMSRACRFVGRQVDRFSQGETLQNVVKDGY